MPARRAEDGRVRTNEEKTPTIGKMSEIRKRSVFDTCMVSEAVIPAGRKAVRRWHVAIIRLAACNDVGLHIEQVDMKAYETMKKAEAALKDVRKAAYMQNERERKRVWNREIQAERQAKYPRLRILRPGPHLEAFSDFDESLNWCIATFLRKSSTEVDDSFREFWRTAEAQRVYTKMLEETRDLTRIEKSNAQDHRWWEGHYQMLQCR
uniref:Uncharacterized protein n=1 Tax=Chromera velia CCMP2878 TaxID=1169474 RepID=A0A0G4HWS3_9ALVE|eukprot:Cvel_9121.t1-p1 / transcript=Cvel_9121.t1 / gene=Cvel_9121 / organism=Chromera_velia_CCMP2878 / gene_product=hypothetical protein / transcript_product=hypothetical protein / location=Cvel_scaffold518:44841-47554(-) / protein_length=207 / sequence_SO=supercontig / SO=protein_coding / is_pseudo=false